MRQMTLVSRACPICGLGGKSRSFAEANVNLDALDAFAFAARKSPEGMHWRLVECLTCDLLYADLAPAPSDLATAYRDAAFDSRAAARYASRTYGRFLPAITARLPDRHGALDIGTGEGSFLQQLLAAGFSDVVGVEPSAAPVAAADVAVRRLIRQDVFRADAFPSETLALVTCFQTIEHVEEPLRLCRDAWRTLKPGGALFLIGHNRRSLSAKVLGWKSPIFDVEHLQLFSPVSLRNLLESAGFADVNVVPMWNCYPLAYWVGLLPLPHWLRHPLTAFLNLGLLSKLLVPLPAGNLAAVGYKT